METIEVVIKMPKEDYMFIKTMVENGYETPSSYYYNIASGIVLPKGHGDLKDVSNLLTVTDYDGKNEKIYVLYDEIKHAPTIVEADKESEGIRNEDSN